MYLKSCTLYNLPLDTLRLISLIVIVASLFLFGYHDNTDLEVKAQGQSTKPITIEIPRGAQNPSNNQFYIPPAAETFPGSQVAWTNNDTVQHTATADDGSFDTGFINPGQKASVTVTNAGTIKYHCSIHPWMIAILTSGSPSTAANETATSNATSVSSSSIFT